MILFAGENVYSAEVERVVASHAAVHLAAVYGVPDPSGQFGELVKAVVQLKDGDYGWVKAVQEIDAQAGREVERENRRAFGLGILSLLLLAHFPRFLLPDQPLLLLDPPHEQVGHPEGVKEIARALVGASLLLQSEATPPLEARSDLCRRYTLLAPGLHWINPCWGCVGSRCRAFPNYNQPELAGPVGAGRRCISSQLIL